MTTNESEADSLTEVEAAALLRVAPETLARWRKKNVGPAHTNVSPFGRGIRYSRKDLDAYLAVRASRDVAVSGEIDTDDEGDER